MNAVTGKAFRGDRYEAATVAHCESVVRGFYDFHLEAGTGPMVNPFPLSRHRGAGRADAHHNPMEPFDGHRSGRYRPKVVTRAPRCIPDERFDELFVQLGSHRDRALVAFWVSTGARASELLGATVADVDPGQQLITVVRKGTRALQQLPAAPDAFVWLRLYQAQLAGLVPAGRDEPLWWTLRRPFPGVALRRGAGDVHSRQRRVGVELVAARSSPHRGVSDGSRPADAADRCAVGAGPRPPVHHAALLEPGDRGRDRRGAGFPCPATRPRPCCTAGGGIPRGKFADPVRRGRVVTGVGEQVLTPRAADTVAAVTGPAERTGAQLAAAFPPRPVVASWPVTEASRSAVLDRVLSAPFALDNPNSQQTRRMGVLAVMNWLRTQSGDSWQQRWVASGARRPARLAAPGRHRPGEAAAASEPRAAGADLRRRDPARPGLAAAVRAGAAQPGHRDGPHPRSGRLRRARRVVQAGRGRVAERAAGTDPGRGHHGRQGRHGRGRCGSATASNSSPPPPRTRATADRHANSPLFYQLLRAHGDLGADAPAAIEMFSGRGQPSCEQLIDRYRIACRPVRDVLVDYLRERQPSVDFSSLQRLAYLLGKLFWADLEAHHPGIDSLQLPRDVAAAWKQRVMTRTRTTTTSTGNRRG